LGGKAGSGVGGVRTPAGTAGGAGPRSLAICSALKLRPMRKKLSIVAALAFSGTWVSKRTMVFPAAIAVVSQI
jgi:hypothetical protein